jgi:hypothetical protein
VYNGTADRLIALRHDNVGGQPELHEPVPLRGLPHLIVHLPASSIHTAPWPSSGLGARPNNAADEGRLERSDRECWTGVG